jgi:hypothetical protein
MNIIIIASLITTSIVAMAIITSKDHPVTVATVLSDIFESAIMFWFIWSFLSFGKMISDYLNTV